MPAKLRKCVGCPKQVRRPAIRCKACEQDRRHSEQRADSLDTFKQIVDSHEETAEGKCVLTKTTSERVKTLEDLVRVCEIDLNEWDVERYVCNKWEMAAISRTRVGDVSVTGDPIVTPIYQVKATLVRKTIKDKTLQILSKELLADIRAEVKSGPARLPRYADKSGGYMFEFAPFDLHMGKYAWDEETVASYDLDSSADLFDASLDFLLERALRLTGGKLDRVLCVFGNDVSHIDSKRAQTTAGTPMDADTRYVKIYRRICAIHRRAVDILRNVAPVDIKIVAGNHDELTAFHLGEILAARYEGVKHVTVDNGARLRKYYEYGVNAFGFTHGDAERVSELPLTMAREQPEMWARCNSREWHIGHKHISEKMSLKDSPARMEQDLFSDKGVRIRRLTSLSAHDAWHTKHAYMDRRACESFVFHKVAGFTDHLSFNVDHFSGKALKV